MAEEDVASEAVRACAKLGPAPGDEVALGPATLGADAAAEEAEDGDEGVTGVDAGVDAAAAGAARVAATGVDAAGVDAGGGDEAPCFGLCGGACSAGGAALPAGFGSVGANA